MSILNEKYLVIKKDNDYKNSTKLDDDMFGKLKQAALDLEDFNTITFLSNSYLKAKEDFFADRLRVACEDLDEAVRYADRSAYRTEHIRAEAELYFDYLENLSPSFVSEAIDSSFGDGAYLPTKDEFCRYMLALKALDMGEDRFVEMYLEKAVDRAHPLVKHISAIVCMEKGEYEMAANHLADVLRSDIPIAGTVLYYVFGHLEDCCRKLENQKNATLYAEARAAQFERLLS